MEYQLFSPPEHLIEIGINNWTRKQAQENLDWIISNLNDRVDFLLRYIEIEYDSSNVKLFLDNVNNFINVNIKKPYYTYLNDNGFIDFTPEGYSFCADLSLLITKLILDNNSGVQLKIAKGKSNVHFNKPILNKEYKEYEPFSMVILYIKRMLNVFPDKLIDINESYDTMMKYL